ncbi:hypothetical protein HYV80_05225 [Candidatus Woesearchaeota archaeon]|nr:hypothetical protein [Candidatus Woesearchaeota archaeon]
MAMGLNLRDILEGLHYFGLKPNVRTQNREINPELGIRVDQYSFSGKGHEVIIITREHPNGHPRIYSQRAVFLHYDDGATKPHAATTLDYAAPEEITRIDGAIADTPPDDFASQQMLKYAMQFVKPIQPAPEHPLDTSDSDIRGM